MVEPQAQSGESRMVAHLDRYVVDVLKDFADPRHEWRRLFSELLGTFFLVLVAAGGGMMGQAFPDTISRTAAVRRTGTDGHVDHLVHGQGLRCPPEPRGKHCLRAPR
jgi:hypothetical protein